MSEKSFDARLGSLDPALPLLASKAAVELELLLQGVPTDGSATRNLAELLVAALDKGDGSGLAMDQDTASLIGTTFDDVKWEAPVLTLADVMAEARKIAERLATTSPPNGDRHAIERTRDFCAALAIQTAAHLRAQSSRPSPFTR